mgnify:CR=1 FL=1
MASGRNNAARKYEDQVPAQREVQPKRHLQVAAAPVKKKKHRRKPAVMQGVYPCIFLVAITAAFYPVLPDAADPAYRGSE